jgi:hypothetical protein
MPGLARFISFSASVSLSLSLCFIDARDWTLQSQLSERLKHRLRLRRTVLSSNANLSRADYIVLSFKVCETIYYKSSDTRKLLYSLLKNLSTRARRTKVSLIILDV